MKIKTRIAVSLILIISILLTFPCPIVAAKSKSTGNIIVDGTKINFTIPTSDTSLLVPADLIFPALGATCKTDRTKGIVKVTFGLKTFEIREGSYEFQIKKKRIFMESSPFFKGNQLMVPLRTIVECVGGGVKWGVKQKAWVVYSRDTLEAAVDIMGDGTSLKEKLASYEQYFTDGKYIFWSAFRDGASIYRADKYGKNQERLLDVATKIIGIDKTYIYYINISEKNHLYKMKKDGTKLKQLVSGSVFDAVLDNGVIKYYSLENGLSLCSVSTDGSIKQILASEITQMNENWFINEDTVISGKTILLKGDLIVNSGHTLTLENTRLVFDTGRELDSSAIERNLKVDNATFIMKGSAILSTRQDNGINFTADYSKLDVQTSGISNIISNILMEHCYDVVFDDNYVIDSSQSGFVNSNSTNGALYANNIIINKDRGSQSWITFLSGSIATDLIIKDNVCVDQGECLFLQYGSDGVITNNLLLGDRFALGLSLRHDAGNSTYDNNFLQLNYDNGYRICEAEFSNGIHADTLDSTTTFSRNVINNAMFAIQIQNMSNCVFDSNRVWSQLFNRFADRSDNVAVSMEYAHHNELINNKFEAWNSGAGLEAFYCSGNRLEGNTFTGFKYGIELWDKSDNNIIKENRLMDCNSNILLESSKGNTVQNNSLISTKYYKINIYNKGDNNWNSNYYSDWKVTTPRLLQDKITDSSPVLHIPVIKKAQTQYQAVVFDPNRLANNYGQMESDGVITDTRLWKDLTVNYVGHDFKILTGGKLTMENVTLYSPSMYSSEPEISIADGATLILKNCKIICDPFRMPIHLQAENGGTLIAENCTFENVYNISLYGAKGSFKNCTFTDCYEALYFDNNTDMTITNCKIINSYTGIDFITNEKSKLTGNTQTNVALKFAEPKLESIVK